MFALIPNPVPAEPGMAVIRVTGAVTPYEHELAKTLCNDRALYRVTLWFEGRVYLTSLTSGPDRLTLCGVIEAFREFPLSWVEVLGKTNPTTS